MAHGAGAGMEHSFMTYLAEEIALLNGTVIRFNFPYKEKGRSSPGSPKPNIAAIGDIFQFVSDSLDGNPVFLSGKSYGGRMSSHLIAENPQLDTAGLIYFGFPLHAPGRDSKDRAAHLYDINTPQLFIQGTKDTLANYTLIQEVVSECKKADLSTIEHADHGFKVPKRITGFTQNDIIHQMAKITNDWALKQI